MIKKVLIGMSGGVDSSVSALLLKKAGYEVIGATMQLLKENGENTVTDAKKICDQIGIEHHLLNNQEEFEKRVIQNFIQEYSSARTPNPCVECNKYLKFGAFYKIAEELNCDYIATGHYAKIEYSEKYKQYVLKKSDSEKKDQTYFLYGINKEILPKILFPLETYKTKEEVRQIAKQNNLKVAEKSDSQEVCFIPDNNYVGFVCKYAKQKKGNIVLRDGTILGNHNGLINYTVGQRKGLGIAYKSPLYVLELNTKTNEVIVGEEQELYSKELEANELNFLLDIPLNEPIKIKAKVRFRAKEADAILYPAVDGTAKVEFSEPQRAITPGQSVVFYIDDIVLGRRKNYMKKFIYILVTILVITAMIFLTICIKTKLQEDALRFKTEYEELNEDRHELSIPENNPIKYVDVKEAVEILRNGTGIMYIGYPKCPSCRIAVPYILEAAKETKTKKIYYLKITEYNNAFNVRDGEIIKTREEKDGYYELLEEAKTITRDYVLREFEKEYIVDEPRIYSPTVLKIENGEITKFKTGAETIPDNDGENRLLQEYIDIMK